MIVELFVLLLVFQLKHLIADYYLQFPRMYENKGKAKGWFFPLMDHALIHALMTFIILIFYSVIAYQGASKSHIISVISLAAIFDFVTHFVTDRWKATRKTDPSQTWFWQSLGIDQMIHHVVGILIVFGVVIWNA